MKTSESKVVVGDIAANLCWSATSSEGVGVLSVIIGSGFSSRVCDSGCFTSDWPSGASSPSEGAAAAAGVIRARDGPCGVGAAAGRGAHVGLAPIEDDEREGGVPPRNGISPLTTSSGAGSCFDAAEVCSLSLESPREPVVVAITGIPGLVWPGSSCSAAIDLARKSSRKALAASGVELATSLDGLSKPLDRPDSSLLALESFEDIGAFEAAPRA